jgi:hypothetical protein
VAHPYVTKEQTLAREREAGEPDFLNRANDPKPASGKRQGLLPRAAPARSADFARARPARLGALRSCAQDVVAVRVSTLLECG